EHPAYPGALAAALGADSIHSIVPVASADQRQAVGADRQAPVERTGAVLEERGALGRDRGLEVRFEAVVRQHRALDEWDLLVENRRVPGDRDVVRGREGEPDPVIGDARPDAAARGRMPPVLDVAFEKL